MKRTRFVVIGAATAAVLSVGGVTAGVVAADDDDGKVSVAAEEKCSETARRFSNNGYVYLYNLDYCEGAHDAKDKDNDQDYGEGGDIKHFDNKVNSIINKGFQNVKFYNYPKYNEGHEEDGDSFCVQRGHWVNKLYLYGDGGGETGTWRNSISSHKFVSASSCSRWFG